MVNPCDNEVGGDAWPGVGHRNGDGGGTRNPFGLDFASNRFVRQHSDETDISRESTTIDQCVTNISQFRRCGTLVFVRRTVTVME